MVGCTLSLMRTQKDIEEKWPLLRILLKSHGTSRHHIDSYHACMARVVGQVFTEEPVEVVVGEDKRFNKELAGLRITFNDVMFGLPVDSTGIAISKPIGARNTLGSYCHPLYFDVTVQKLGRDREVLDSKHYPSIAGGHIPTMIRSKFCSTVNVPDSHPIRDKECLYGVSGLFLINDVEKIVISQEDSVCNRAILQARKSNGKSMFQAQITSKHSSLMLKSSSTLYIRALQIPALRQQVCWLVRVRLPFIKLDIPMCVLFKAMGVSCDRDIVHLLFHPHELCGSVECIVRNCLGDAPQCTQEGARQIILSKCTNSTWESIITNDLLSNMGTNIHGKIACIGSICRGLILLAAGLRRPDDRDHFQWKRVRASGHLLSWLFKTQINKRIRNEIKSSMKNCLETGRSWDVTGSLNSSSIFKGSKYWLATGNLQAGKSGGAQAQKVLTGTSQLVSRLSPQATISQTRRVNSSMQRELRQSLPREHHSTHTGRFDPPDTPEGQPIGLVRQLSVSAYLSSECDVSAVVDIVLKKHAHESPVFPRWGWPMDAMLLHLNGTPLAVLLDPMAFVKDMKGMRRVLAIPWDVSIAFNTLTREVHIQTDEGRLCSIKIVSGHESRVWGMSPTEELLTTFNELLPHLECLDAEEEETCLIGSHGCNQATNQEIHMSALLGLTTLSNPFSNHNFGPRQTFSDVMCKQGMSGSPLLNFESVFPTSINCLDYPQRPVCTTLASHALGLDDLPSGQMFIVAVMCYDDWTIEDAIQISRKSVDMGIGRCTVYRSIDTTESREFEHFEKPNPEKTIQLKKGSYDHLQENGLPRIGAHVSEKDILVGKTMNFSMKKNGAADNNANALRKDVSVQPKNCESGIVHKIHRDKTATGDNIVKVMLRQVREPIPGSKFASRHGMKGTISMLFEPEDAPYDPLTGITPDIIMNPHSKPSRMSWGEMMEALCSMLGILKGEFMDSTPFSDRDEFFKSVREEIQKEGMDGNCQVMLQCGITGRRIGKCFMGPIFVQRLKHMVEDKIWARNRGPRQLLTRQPTEGRMRRGGFKIGEMEQAVLLSHGASNFIRERLFKECDQCIVPVCRSCGVMAIHNKDHNFSYCTLCNQRDVGTVETKYATKLLFQELQCMNIVPQLITKPLFGPS